MMLQAASAGDYVMGSGQAHTVQEFAQVAFDVVGLDWRQHVRVDDRLCRPPEKHVLCANSTKLREHLGWAPTVDFADVVREMVETDVASLSHQWS